MEKLNLKYLKTDNGFDRVYYSGKYENGNKGLFCSVNMGTLTNPIYQIDFCSKDGEPDSPINSDQINSIELSKGFQSADIQFNNFLHNYWRSKIK